MRRKDIAPIEPRILDWTAAAAHPAWPAGNLLDIRPEAAYRAGHPPRAVSRPLETPDGGLVAVALDRALPSIFLPPRHEPLLIIASRRETALPVARELLARGRDLVDALVSGPGDLPERIPRETGPSRGRLWRPPPYLVEHAHRLPPPAAGPVLDLACGSGRAGVWLAERGYRVTGVDRQPEALAMGRLLALDRGVDCRFLERDLREPGAVPAGPWAGVLNFRFLQRDLLERLHPILQPGGVAVVRTFRAAPGYEGHPQPRHRLGPAELLRYFPAGRYEVEAHEENFDPDGRPAAGIVARRRFVLPDRPR